jgi:hypothetical protein
MDSVRFGRVLGIGTRLAAKTVANAVDAAMAPDPSSSQTQGTPTSTSNAASAVSVKTQSAAATTARTVEQARTQVRQTQQGLTEGGKRIGGTVRRLSGVLWLEFTGVFFGLFAFSAATAAWKLRPAWRDTPDNHVDHLHLLFAILMTVVFGYFCVTSFLRARSKSRAR